MITDISTLSRILGVTPYGNASDRTIDTLLTDSRSLDIAGSSIFFAIKTPTADGARYVRPLYERGVRAFVVESLPDDTEYMPEAAFFVVENTVAALQKIAGYHPEFHGVMVGITGSRGKTTLKEWIFQLMEPLAEIIRSPRSYN
ncbi:MAG: bifunctional UDP-N-acetylmuramoyl-tripeptide:D-alanyl-D-alanine ligase/alanine racemase, partial [Muribaculaceae bacterium]|nr:bifunctional UDP-N-acetylmuramoyl-tripeptide:D-alanyl-D-alanine ligase/alanine racemase [Muribaculaceae bacterium]